MRQIALSYRPSKRHSPDYCSGSQNFEPWAAPARIDSRTALHSLLTSRSLLKCYAEKNTYYSNDFNRFIVLSSLLPVHLELRGNYFYHHAGWYNITHTWACVCREPHTAKPSRTSYDKIFELHSSQSQQKAWHSLASHVAKMRRISLIYAPLLVMGRSLIYDSNKFKSVRGAPIYM
jgi:hypothetical protein